MGVVVMRIPLGVMAVSGVLMAMLCAVRMSMLVAVSVQQR
jgi:hypothetical protein